MKTSACTSTPLFIDDPRLNVTQIEAPHLSAFICDPITGQLVIKPERRAKLSADARAYITGLLEEYLDREAEAVHNCSLQGVVDRHCTHGRAYAHAQHIRCQDPFCRTCGRSRYRLGHWSRKRDLKELTSYPHLGFELVLPWKPKPGLSVYETAEHLRRGRDRAAWYCAQFMSRLELDAVVFDDIDPSEPDTVRIRVAAMLSSLRWAKLDAEWKLIAGPSAWVEHVTHAGAGPDSDSLMTWVFASFEEGILLRPGRERAIYRKVLKGCQMVRTYGDQYQQLSEDELRARRERDALMNMCPVHKDHRLEIIPRIERTKANVEDINKSYALVDWTSAYTPFRSAEAQARVIHREPIMHNDVAPWMVPVPMLAHAPC